MRNVWRWSLVALCLGTMASSGFSQTNIYEALQFASNALVGFDNVPDGFRIFVADSTSQVFTNPARAAALERGFAYAIRYTPRTQPDFGFATLLKSGGGSWWVQFEHRVGMLDRQISRDFSTIRFPLEPERRRTEEFESFFENDLSFARLRLSRVGGTGSHGHAIGLAVLAQWAPRGRTSDIGLVETVMGEVRPDVLVSRRMESQVEIVERVDERQFAVGLEAAWRGADWDFITGIRYQTADRETRLKRDLYALQRDTTYQIGIDTSRIFFETRRLSEGRAQVEPNFLHASTFLQKRAPWLTAGSHLFLSLEAFYALESNISFETERLETRLISIEEGHTDTLRSMLSGEADGDFWSLEAAVGYVIRHRIQDVRFFVGLRPQFTYADLNDVVLDDRIYDEFPPLAREEKTWRLNAAIPVFVDYQPTAWLSLFAGVTFAHVYEHVEGRSMVASNSGEATTELSLETNVTDFHSSNRVYAGTTLRYRHRLVAQLAFRGDLARLSSWNLAVGYHF